MAAGRTRYARHGGLRIAYEVRRRRFRRLPWMVLIQGLGFDRNGWKPVVRGLSSLLRRAPGGSASPARSRIGIP